MGESSQREREKDLISKAGESAAVVAGGGGNKAEREVTAESASGASKPLAERNSVWRGSGGGVRGWGKGSGSAHLGASRTGSRGGHRRCGAGPI